MFISLSKFYSNTLKDYYFDIENGIKHIRGNFSVVKNILVYVNFYL